ncbi:MAG TPA: hypothetical protein VGE24_05595 [Emticicia sp.]
MWLTKKYIIIIILFCGIRVCYASDTTRFHISIGAGRCFSKFLLHREAENENSIKSASIIENAGNFGVINFKINRSSYFLCYSKLNRNFDLEYNENNGIIETYKAKSQLSSIQAGITYPIYDKRIYSVFLSGSIEYNRGFYLNGVIVQYNKVTNQSTSMEYHPHNSFPKTSILTQPGIGIDIRLYRDLVNLRSQVTYACNLSNNAMTYGINRFMFSSSINYTFFAE